MKRNVSIIQILFLLSSISLFSQVENCRPIYGGFVTVLSLNSDSSDIALELDNGRFIRPAANSPADFNFVKSGDRVRLDYDILSTSSMGCPEIVYQEVSINCLEILSPSGCGTFTGTVVEDACGNRFYKTEGLQVASGLINPGRWEALPNLGATIQFYFEEWREAWIYCADSSSVTSFGYIDCFEVIDDGTPSDQCTVTIANRECRTIGVYDENDNLLSMLPPAPSIISAFYQVTLPVWDDPRPLATNTTRKYIFKQNDLIVGSQTVTCAQPFIDVDNKFGSDIGDGCGDALGLAPINNIGCRPLQVYGTDGRLIQTVAPKEEIYLDAYGFFPIYVLVADQDTIAVGPYFDVSYFDTGGCEEASPCVLLMKNEGWSSIQICDEADNVLRTLGQRSTYEQLLPADTTLNFIFKEDGVIIGCQTVSCNQPQIIIEDFCFKNDCEDLRTIEGTVFWDRNGNGQKDESEEALGNTPIQLASSSLTTYTNEVGNFRFFVQKGLHNIMVNFDSCWALSTDAASYTITVDENTATQKVDFGLQLIAEYQHTQARITSAPTRCGFTVPFTLSIENDGCLPAKGQFALVLHPLVTVIGSNISSGEVRGDTLFWTYDPLIAKEVQRFEMTMEIAGADFIGEVIELTGLTYIEDEFGNLSLSSNYTYSSEIRCAYDPNDKLVSPQRAVDRSSEFDQNFTLFEETLEYTIRFQNTGNDTAFNVVLRDTLDKNLDWTTFKPITASHPYEAFLYKNGAVEFSFEDILLPDSTTNEPLSHGFISYKIATLPTVPENASIENTASIYFDFNPPIVTNTTQNVMVSELPKITSIHDFSLHSAINLYPNPFNDFITIEQKEPCNKCHLITLYDALGRPLQNTVLTDAIETISTTSIASGVYYYQINSMDGQPIVGGKLIKN